ncbi:methyl-accepting chemotaxis protein [Thiorhodococcus minor]|uniref:HAMP domain-containing protein n=1 Tax=Thiorhodococcus minor TaxID=57489 RepID=A0A6M0JYW5_9GAMM|nr:methyl-accepting chemotaxis protein [Thiorhodococcus minor]NEV62652.1 HAMP domain-containing protein [Thiorhodococcus minor]
MSKLATRLTIGEKIGLGFGLVGLILLGVIWHYDLTLSRVLKDYGQLHSVYGARQLHAFEIERRLLGARSAEERFLMSRDLELADQVREEVGQLDAEIDRLAALDADVRGTADALRAQAQSFLGRFDAIVEAWRIRGLDEDSGLQGAFRDAVHELEDLAGHYDVDRPYLLLLQIRRREKDLGLRRDPAYQDQVHQLIEALRSAVAASELTRPVKHQLDAEIATYRKELDAYASVVLDNRDIDGGKGPFRDAAHRIEAILEAHYIPDMKVQILQLRRREKDYLLRRDAEYIGMVDSIAAGIRDQVRASRIADDEKARLDALLAGYERDFHALVDQDARIAQLMQQIDEAVASITRLAQENLRQARTQMQEMSAQIDATSVEKARLSLSVAAGALVLGALLAFLITRRIVRPVREMAGLLDRLTHENPTERIETDPKGRDEINAMAISLNTMADHKATFFHWWRSSMQEAIALRDLSASSAQDERDEATEELRLAAMSKLQQLNGIKGKIQRDAERVREIGERIQADPSRACAEDGVTLAAAGTDIGTLLEVIEDQ